MRLKAKYTLSGIKQASNGTLCRKEAHFRLIFQVAFKRCVLAAKSIKNHFCAEAEADEKGIEAAFAHQLPIGIAEIKKQLLFLRRSSAA